MFVRRLFLLGLLFTFLVVGWSLWRYSFLRHKAPQEYLADLRHKKSAIRAMSAYELGQLKLAQAVTPLILALGDSSYEVRWNAAVALGNIGDPRAIDSLKLALEDPDPSVQICAVRSLGMFRRPELTQKILPFLKHPHPGMRLAACWSLGHLEDISLATYLEPLLSDSEEEVRFGAALELAKFQHPGSEPILQEMKKSKRSFYREKAQEALKGYQ